MDKREIIDIKGLPVYLQADVVVCGGSERACAANDECAHEGRTQMFLSASGYDEASGSISAGQNQ